MSLPQFVLDFFRSELFRYIISGFIAFFCDFAILVTATEVFGIHYLVSNIAGYSVGLIVSYTININWVFNHRRFGEKQHHDFFTSLSSCSWVLASASWYCGQQPSQPIFLIPGPRWSRPSSCLCSISL